MKNNTIHKKTLFYYAPEAVNKNLSYGSNYTIHGAKVSSTYICMT